MERQLLWCSIFFLIGSVIAETCPGGQVRCPDFMTCCQLGGDEFGCCPFPDAKCCADHVHCCPHSMECDVSHQSCLRNGSPVSFYWQVPIHPEMVEPVVEERPPQNEVNDLQQFRGSTNNCPDSTVCHSGFTCCKMYSGKYGCCPLEDGTCCQDGFHCCPHGSRCSPSGECYSIEQNYTVNAYPLEDKKYEKYLKAQQLQGSPAHQDVSDPGGKCPDGHPCPEKYTCCKITGKRYGCCPYIDARCCDDGIHCCPKGTNCNITLGTCDIQKTFGWSFPSQSLVSLQWSEAPKEVVSNHIEVVHGDVVCPDEEYHCPSGSTCCQLESGAYGCCPMEKATCCSDKEHCCPFGYKCVADGCMKGSHHLPPFLRTTAAVRVPQETKVERQEITEVGDVICPDQYPCPDHNTCCQLTTGEYGCCPMEKATCCPDKIHCCPHGFRCVDEGCRKKTGSSWILPNFLSAIAVTRQSEIVKAYEEELGDDQEVPKEDLGIMCPDDQSQCPDGATCCQLASGAYGCCPLEDATCCGDQEHCCPHGYWCSDDGCDRMPGTPHHVVPFLHKLSSARKLPSVILLP